MKKTQKYNEQRISNAAELLMEHQQGISVTSSGVFMKVELDYGETITVNLDDDRLCRHLEHLFFNEYKVAISTTEARQAIRKIKAKSEFEIKQTRMYPRIFTKDDVCYIFTGNTTGDVIAVSAGDVSRVPLTDVGVLFNTSVGEIGAYDLEGNPFDLFKLIRVPESLQLLIMVSAIASMIEPIEKPILSFIGEAGAAKTTAARIIKEILDPSDIKDNYKAKTSAMPKKRDDFALIISQQNITIMDNVTSINQEISDLMCQQSTGGNYEKRQLYTDTNTVSLSLGGLLMITSTEDVIDKDDAVDRTIKVPFDSVSDMVRVDHSELVKKLEELKPLILGGMLRVLSKALEIYPRIKDKRLSLPRLADFGRYGYAIGEALGEGMGDQFLADYNQLREAQKTENLNNDGFFSTINTLLTIKHPFYWKGFKGQCVSALQDINNEESLGYHKSCFPAANKLDKKLEATKHKFQLGDIEYITSKKDGMAIVEFFKVPTDYIITARIVKKQQNMPRLKHSEVFDIRRVPILEDVNAIRDFNRGFIQEVVADLFDEPYSVTDGRTRILKAVIDT